MSDVAAELCVQRLGWTVKRLSVDHGRSRPPTALRSTTAGIAHATPLRVPGTDWAVGLRNVRYAPTRALLREAAGSPVLRARMGGQGGAADHEPRQSPGT
eukprot:3355179-Rhodomonas_salina.1